jgi:hypothetical protein
MNTAMAIWHDPAPAIEIRTAEREALTTEAIPKVIEDGPHGVM